MAYVKIKCIDRSFFSFYVTIENKKKILDLKEIIAEKLNKKKELIVLKKSNSILYDDLDLDTYEFSNLDSVEIEYI